MTQHNLYAQLFAGFSARLQEDCLRLPDGETLSYADIDRQSGQLAQGLLDLGLQPGDRVMLQLNKSVLSVLVYLACLRANIVLVPLNTSYTERELDHFISDCEPALFIGEAPHAPAALVANKGNYKQPMDALFQSLDAPPPAAAGECASATAQTLAAIVYTSGTTGKPKGAMLSHGNLGSNARTLHSLWGFVPGDVLLHALPVFHVHGLFVALNTALLNGSPIVFLPTFEAAEVSRLLSQVTVFMGVPTFYHRLLQQPDCSAQSCAGIRVFISGSAPMSAALSDAFYQHSGQRVLERYGMTETGMISSNPLHGERVAGSVGFALPGVSLRITDENGNTLAAGETGNVEVKGPNVFGGYWRMPEKTATDFRADGFFITGDLGQLDHDGRLTLVGRANDLIICGGYNVYPKEIEILLDRLPTIIESAVIGVPHPDLGEAVVAVCAADPDTAPKAEQIMADIAPQLARFKQPRALFLRDALPRNAMGKIQKQLLREQYSTTFSTA